MPVLKVLLVIIAGLILATQRFDLLGCDARRHLNNMVFYVFYPALIGCSLADTMTLEANLGNMLLIILPALCEEKNNPFGEVASTCSANGKAYASLSLA
ncbi:hypothetical protein Gohar_027502, partial [Gossypium harknessii]|nr:hypothetical protein [Gossypium harknessii]